MNNEKVGRRGSRRRNDVQRRMRSEPDRATSEYQTLVRQGDLQDRRVLSGGERAAGLGHEDELPFGEMAAVGGLQLAIDD